ncbi:YdeI/OmpD-associated family protein [Agromyces sp. Marseille-P2726]|uniref:YdeI/OmpD-associated family protein n=1 Tax=Agromyces sp. Marseille-P2726 TaxID=2709132 RepID=UPI00156E0277|nr:YdeI/OmpD-associated family protein [Agromyces sp. Marseille-P2726]
MRFETTMFLSGNNTGIEVPPEVIEALGAGKKPPVKVTVNGFEYRSTVAVMGGRFLIPFSSDKRAATGIQGGDPIVVELEVDSEPRTVEVPDDLAAALDAAPGARAAWEKLPPSHKKAHVTAVESAKAPETRQRRISKAVESLSG